MSFYSVQVRSPYTEPVDKGIRSFDLEATDMEDAQWFAIQHIVSGRETIISIEESKNEWGVFEYDVDEVITKGNHKKAISKLNA